LSNCGAKRNKGKLVEIKSTDTAAQRDSLNSGGFFQWVSPKTDGSPST
jgi:hypothetical protein